MPETPELQFQRHISDYLVRVHGHGRLEADDVIDPDYAWVEDQLWAFLADTQGETVARLAEQYGADARDQVFSALRAEVDRVPLWTILRHGLTVRGLDFRLYYPPPRSTRGGPSAPWAQPNHLPPAFLLRPES